MNALFVAAFLCTIAVALAVPSGLGAIIAGPVGLGGAVIAGPALGGIGAITAGGGAISLSGHGAAVQGPPTAPAVISGPSGTVAANGLWGPTPVLGVGALGAPGAWGHGWLG